MTALHPAPAVPVAAFCREPDGSAPRGTVIVVPGRGERRGEFATRVPDGWLGADLAPLARAQVLR